MLNSAILSASDQNLSGVDIAGSLKSKANTTYEITFFASQFANSSESQRTYIGTTSVTTDSKGARNFTAKLPAAVPVGYLITATATSPTGNTSPPSAGRAVTATDSDGDGMPNKYESTRKFNQNNPADAAFDSDGDGMTNLAEFRAGTDPKSAASRFAMLSVSLTSASPRVVFQSVAGKTYRVEFRNTVSGGEWKTLLSGIFTPQATQVEVSDPAGKTGTRYYRVVLEPGE